jgi:nucleoside 2-deoxyribosyltransferase
VALEGYAANHVFRYDRSHLDRASAGILLLPAGKSGHLEAGYLIGQGKPVWILMPGEPERFDVMYRFASGVFTNKEDLFLRLPGRQNAREFMHARKDHMVRFWDSIAKLYSGFKKA